MSVKTVNFLNKEKALSPKSVRYGILAGMIVFVLVLLVGAWVLYGNKTSTTASTVQQNQLTTEEAQAQVMLVTAQDLIDAGNNASAEKILTEALAILPDNGEILYYRGVANNNLGEFQAAVDDFSAAITASPHWALPLAGRGSAYVAMGESVKALEDYDKALQLEPGSADLYTNRGQIHMQRGEFAEATKDLDLAVQLSPDSVASHFNRGVLYYSLSQVDAAIADFTRAIELDPTAAPPYFNRGAIYADNGETEKAIADFETFLKLSDNPTWIQYAQERLSELQK